jgi:glycosyltransferase involved in cell wall biosynthesis
VTDVIHVISGLGVGGAETMLAQIAPRLAEQGMSQTVVSLTGDGPIAARLEAEGVPVVRLDLRRGAGPLRDLPRLARLVGAERPKILQGWMYHGDLAATVAHALAGGRSQRRLLWGIRCSNMDLERNARIIGWEARLSRWPDAIVANSKAGAEAHLAHGYRPRRLEVIPNGVDTDRFRPDPAARQRVRAELGLDEEALVAIHAARVDPMKDHDTLLAAAAQVPGLVVLLAGLGTEEYLAARPDAPKGVRALGRRDDLPALLPAADIVVSSSAFGEGFSNALAEGMAAGLVPVTTEVGDAARIVGDTGAVVPPGDPAALGDALSALAATPREAVRRGGLAARSRIEAEFGIDRTVDRFAELYEELAPELRSKA